MIPPLKLPLPQSGPQFIAGNQLHLLNSGHEYFPALLDAINAARDEIHLETYIFADDETGRAVAAALARAAQRGVSVRLLVDGFGGHEFVDTLMPALLADGVEVLIYRQELFNLRALFRLRRYRLRRMHRKLVVIDGNVAFVGGINIIDDRNTPHQKPPRYDYAVRVRGPLLAPIHGAVQHLWELVRWAGLKRRFPAAAAADTDSSPAGEQSAAFIIRDNIGHRRDIEDAYLAAIEVAERDIIIANAYFLPGLRFRRALADAARRGVSVTLLLQGKVEYRLLHYATQALYGALFGAGVRIFEYRKSFMHAKVAVIDEAWATVGSSNIDPLSLLLAREGNLVANDRAFARELRRSLAESMAEGAVELSCRDWQHRPWLHRVVHWASYGLVRVLIGVAGYGKNPSAASSVQQQR